MKKILSKDEWKRKKRFKLRMKIGLLIIFPILMLFLLMTLDTLLKRQTNQKVDIETLSSGPATQQMYLTPNEYSRPQTPLTKVKSIVVHYTANPGTSANANRSYFEGLKDTKTTYASSHYIIGLEGEIIQCLPLTEISYASNNRNQDTISIECCHMDESGKFNEKTYDALIALLAQLCVEFDLKEEDIIRHYDVTHKECPLYYVKHEDEWVALKEDVAQEIKQIKNESRKMKLF